MAERKQVNKYYPPDFDPSKHFSLNKYHGTHALRERARKLDQGILIIRFEMPYNIWCNGCENHVGMSVRFNAQKSKIGMYYTTPIYKFRMKCHLCPNHFEMKTDPQNLDYIIISGARRQERRWDAIANEQIQTEEKKEHHKMEKDSMYKLERGVEDEGKKMSLIPTMERLVQIQDTLWDDDFSQNKRLRDQLRKEKKMEKIKTEEENSVKSKYSLNIPILDKSDKDKYLAKLILHNAKKDHVQLAKSIKSSMRKQKILPSSSIPRNIKLSKKSKLFLEKLKNTSSASSKIFSNPNGNAYQNVKLKN
ncbi:unnamed protein product [Gordionus sp. m RMFG-2023]|uniref:probable splicing factor YJU2B n=1 Tax=Gordionus sp. m RMFG-2023 TaxID=3053472 RepID=UPI0030E11489